MRLQIPTINVDAAIEPMGVTPSGEMEAPGGPRNVGWYSFGPHPGASGSAVIDGHFGRWTHGASSVFDDLRQLKTGDSIYVKDGQGATATFVVRESGTYNPKADSGGVFKSSDGLAHLNLITCEGAWNKVSKSYPDRLVVFSDKKLKKLAR